MSEAITDTLATRAGICRLVNGTEAGRTNQPLCESPDPAKGGAFSLPQAQLKHFSRLHGQKYRDYIRSDAWQNKRREFFASKLYANCCGRCFASGVPVHIHHKTYARLGNERLGDLIALCESCHTLAHERASRTGDLWKAHKKGSKRVAKAFVYELARTYSQRDWRQAWSIAKRRRIAWNHFAKIFNPIFNNGSVAFASYKRKRQRLRERQLRNKGHHSGQTRVASCPPMAGVNSSVGQSPSPVSL